MNSCNFVGRIGNDLEITQVSDNFRVLNISLAVRKRFVQEGKPDTNWLRIKAFNNTADFIKKYFSKGDMIALETYVDCGSYEKDGNKVFTTDFCVTQASFVGGKKDNSAPQAGVAPATTEEINEDMPF